MPRQLCRIAVLLALYAACTLLFHQVIQLQRRLQNKAGSLALERPEKAGQKRSSFTLQYVFVQNTQDDTPKMKHVSYLSEASEGGVQPNVRLPEPFPIVTKTWHGEGGQESKADGGHLAPRPGPDVSDRETIINLAMMTSDAYVFGPSEPDWLNSTNGFNHSSGFGWDGVGLRGHIFTNAENRTVIVSFKGTSLDPREKWRANDRLNDILLFSCCCGDQRPDPYPYGPVCGCCSGTYSCNSTCLTQELCQTDRYYVSALAVVQKVVSLFPNAHVWAIGHSLGGAVASLVGLTYNLPTVTFEAPPERLAAQRLGLLFPREVLTYHFGHTADPVYMGACNGWSSSCGLAGYAFESQCFTGEKCVYDTVGDAGWRLSIANHRINTVIQDVLEKYNTTPACELDEECVDCYNWNFTPSST